MEVIYQEGAATSTTENRGKRLESKNLESRRRVQTVGCAGISKEMQ